MGVVHFFLREMDDARLLELFNGGVLFCEVSGNFDYAAHCNWVKMA